MGDKIIPGRMTAEHTGDITVFLIGMRINSFWRLRDWLPVTAAMPRMLAELRRDPSLGMLGGRQLFGGPRLVYLVQYWASAEHLQAYASSQEHAHRPAWTALNRRLRKAGRGVGFWHETYVIPAGSHEQIYVNMPAFGLGAASGAIPVSKRGERAAERMSQRQPS